MLFIRKTITVNGPAGPEEIPIAVESNDSDTCAQLADTGEWHAVSQPVHKTLTPKKKKPPKKKTGRKR